MSKRYLEQYDSVKRWFGRIKSINEGEKHTFSSDYYQDEIYAFFINCYHLKDWIKNDPAYKEDSKDVEMFIAKSEFLTVCDDICTGSKHLAITDKRKDPATRISGRSFFLGLGWPLPIFKAKYKITCRKKVYDAFNLATACLKDWDGFIAKYEKDS